MSARCVIWQFEMDYVPWDTPDAMAFGHGEPAMLLRLLDYARSRGLKFQFFVSNRVLRAFPASADATLNEGHALDWLCKHPERVDEAFEFFGRIGHRPGGFLLKAGTRPPVMGLDRFRFAVDVAEEDLAPAYRFFSTRPSLREVIADGGSVSVWAENTRADLQSDAEIVTVGARPQTLAKVDPKLTIFDSLVRASGDRSPTTYGTLVRLKSSPRPEPAQ